MYLLDTNVLIEAKNRYYRMTFMPGFWDFLSHLCQIGEVCSTYSVYEEIVKGKDELTSWAKANRAIFLDDVDELTIKALQSVSQRVVALGYTQAACQEFLSVADSKLISFAATYNHKVVTNEKAGNNSLKKVKIPDLCKEFNIPCVDTFDFLEAVEARFVMA